MAQRHRCPGGRPSVSYKWVKKSQKHWMYSSKKSNKFETKNENYQPNCSLPESARDGKGGLFLGRFDQGLIGNAESAHVNRPKGKATIVPKVMGLQY